MSCKSFCYFYQNFYPETSSHTYVYKFIDASVEEETEEIELSDEEHEDSLFEAEFKLHKTNYYMDKMEYKKVTKSVFIINV